MNPFSSHRIASLFFSAALALLPCGLAAESTNPPVAAPEIRTPKAPATPRINGPGIFGVRPGHPLLYHIPATGERPMEFSAANLPIGLQVNARSGLITGSLKNPGEHTVLLRAKNSKGAAEKKFRIVVGALALLTWAIAAQPASAQQPTSVDPQASAVKENQSD